MLKYLLLLLLTLTGYHHSGAKGVSNNEQSLLWKVSHPQMKKPSYLFGTIHLICPEDYIWTKPMNDALKKADEVCFEMDMDDPTLMMTIAQGMIDRSGKMLKDYFTEEQYVKLSKLLLDSLETDISIFRQMKPAALQMLVVTNVVDCAAPVAYENMIMDSAHKYNKEITGLEQPEEQLELFLSLPADSIAEDILDGILNKTDGKAQYDQLVQAYKRQEIDTLLHLINTSQSIGDNLSDFLDTRNIKWIERIVDKMDQRSVFFAVGAGHLPGQKGLINLLREQGYSVEPIK